MTATTKVKIPSSSISSSTSSSNEDIAISVPKTLESEREAFNPVRIGVVNFFDTSKGFGFIIDSVNQEKYFTHVSGLIDQITEGNKVSFELEKGQKGMNAVKVKLEK